MFVWVIVRLVKLFALTSLRVLLLCMVRTSPTDLGSKFLGYFLLADLTKCHGVATIGLTAEEIAIIPNKYEHLQYKSPCSTTFLLTISC